MKKERRRGDKKRQSLSDSRTAKNGHANVDHHHRKNSSNNENNNNNSECAKNGIRTKTSRHKPQDAHDKAHLNLTNPYLREFDFTDSVYTPHTVTALVVFVLLFLFMIRYYYYPQMSVVASVKLGLAASAFSFVVFGAVHLPDSQLVRPHPCVWRVVLAFAILYLALLSFLLFQNLETVRAIAGLYDPSLLVPLEEGQYAEDCRISTPSNRFLFVHTAFDIFILAHSLGYFVKTLIVRDWRVATCLSVGFEIIEVTFQHVLPNFKECWWDHLLLDVLLCNGGGTLLGLFVLRKLRVKEYHWIALRDIQGYKSKTQRIISQLCPRSFELYEWNVFHTLKRFLQFMTVLMLLFLQEINTFTMKHILQMPPKHHIVILRLTLWSFVAMPTLREVYVYINAPGRKTLRLGTTAWVAISILLLETILIAKLAMEGGYFQDPMPNYIAVPWMLAVLLFAMWLALFFGVVSLQQRQEKRGLLYAISNVFFYGCCGCILALFAMGMPDLQLGRRAFEDFIAPYEQRLFFWRV